MVNRDALLEKLKHLTGDQMRYAGIQHDELMRLISLLQEDALPLDASLRGGYSITTPCIGQPERSVMGPGLAAHDRPVFQSELDAERACRCLGRAFAAGQRNRSGALRHLLDDK